MKIDKNELQNALEQVKPGLASRELIEQSTSFAFMGDRVVTYNDEISISHPVENLNVTGAVEAKTLYQFLSKVKREEIELEWEENQVKITAGKSTAGLTLEQEVKLPVEEVGEIGEWKDLPEGFTAALKRCAPCCSRDMSRPVLTCIHVNEDAVEASDSFQIIRYHLEEPVPVDRFLIPATSAKELVKCNPTRIAWGEGWVHFQTEGGTVFSTRVFEGEFPDVSGHLEMEGGTPISWPKTVPVALERAEIFANTEDVIGDMPVATVSMKDGQMEISARSDSGWFQETMRTKYKGEEIKFMASVESLIQLLDLTQHCVWEDYKICFTGDTWTHVVATVGDE